MTDTLVYITVANSKRIVKSIDRSDMLLAGEVYKRPICFFNRIERQSLLLLKEFFMDPEKFFSDYFDRIINRDTLKFVFEENQPAYHNALNCERLMSDFINYLIPQEIHERGTEEVYRFREWCKDNLYLLKQDKKDIFLERCRLAFGLSLVPELVEYNNSGAHEFDNLTITEIEQRIDRLLNDAANFYYSDEKTKTILYSLSKVAYLGRQKNEITANNTGYSDAEVKEILAEYDSMFKQPIINLLHKWYMITYNKNIAVSAGILENLGFRKCYSCKN